MDNRQFFFLVIFLLFFLSGPEDSATGYPEYQNKLHVLQKLTAEYNANINYLNSSEITYESGYNNITGYKLSYEDAVLGRNITNWPFDDRIGVPFKEDESLSILPNEISQLAANVWNTEEDVISLPHLQYNEEYSGLFPKKLKQGENEEGGDIEDGDNDNDDKSTGTYWMNITSTLRGEFKMVNNDLAQIHMPLPEYYLNLTNLRKQQHELFDQDQIDHFNKEMDMDADGSNHVVRMNDFQAFEDESNPRLGNITFDNGPVKVYIKNVNASILDQGKYQKGEVPISDVSSRVVLRFHINNEDEDLQHDLDFSGVYHKDTGNLVAVTNSAKFLGDFGIPFLNLNNHYYYNETLKMMNGFFKTHYDEDDLTVNYLDEMIEASKQCEYVTYLHFDKTKLSKFEMELIDNEFNSPLGRPIGDIPNVEITNGLIYSPNCGMVFKFENLSGLRDESYMKSYSHNTYILAIVLVAEIFLLTKQMNASSTPSILSRLSMYTVGIIMMTDGLIAIVLSMIALIYNQVYKQLAICSFLAFIGSAAVEMRFLTSIYGNQINERNISFRTALQGTPIDQRVNNITNTTTNNNNDNADANDTINETANTNTNVNANANPTQQQLPVVQDGETGALYFRFMFLLIALSIIVLNSVFWPKTQRLVFEYFSLILINSYWLPQIYRNVIRGSRRSFQWKFIISFSIIRLIPIYYIVILDNERPPFYHHKDWKLVNIVSFWVLFQVFILYLQEILGPRFLLPNSMLPKTYDYHPIITVGDLENDFNFSDEVQSQDADSAQGKGQAESQTLINEHLTKYKVTCSICMNTLEVPVANKRPHSHSHSHTHSPMGGATTESSSLVPSQLSNILNRRSYMVTPCKHIFHTECLEGWMRYKLQCPSCRNTLPPL